MELEYGSKGSFVRVLLHGPFTIHSQDGSCYTEYTVTGWVVLPRSNDPEPPAPDVVVYGGD